MNTELQAVQVPISSLKAAPYNPRKLSDTQLDSIIKSIQEFGFVENVVANKRNKNIIGGHARILAAKKLGYKTAPVVWVDLDDANEKTLNISLNNLGGVFDNDLLAEILIDLPDDLFKLTGFDDDYMADLQPSPLDDLEERKKGTLKIKRYTTEELRDLSATYYPEQRKIIASFLLWIDERS